MWIIWSYASQIWSIRQEGEASEHLSSVPEAGCWVKDSRLSVKCIMRSQDSQEIYLSDKAFQYSCCSNKMQFLEITNIWFLLVSCSKFEFVEPKTPKNFLSKYNYYSSLKGQILYKFWSIRQL